MSTREPSGVKLVPTKSVGNITPNIDKIGIWGGLHLPFDNANIKNAQYIEQTTVDTMVKLAERRNITKSTKDIAIRDILPDVDFIDGNENTISGRAWRQPWSGHYEAVDSDVLTYKIDRTVNYHNKMYGFWGIRTVDDGIYNAVNSTSITWKDSVNTYDIWNVEGLSKNSEMFTFAPIIVQNYVEFSIYVRPKASGVFDNYQFLGKVLEPRGENIIGSPVL